MGILGDLFGNSKIKEFKNKFIKVYNLLSNISYRGMPRDIGLQKAEKEYDIFIAIARSFDDPFAEYFNLYASTTTVFGEKTSVAEAIVIIYLAKKTVLEYTRLSKDVQITIVLQARNICASFQGREAIHEILYS